MGVRSPAPRLRCPRRVGNPGTAERALARARSSPLAFRGPARLQGRESAGFTRSRLPNYKSAPEPQLGLREAWSPERSLAESPGAPCRESCQSGCSLRDAGDQRKFSVGFACVPPPTPMAGPRAALRLLLVLLLLLGDARAAPARADVHCLTSDVTITPHSRTGESYNVKMQLDGKDITASSCVTELKASMEDMASETKKPLLETEPRHYGTSYLISLHCQREANGSIHGNLTFGFAEKIYLNHCLREKHWRVVDPVGRELMKILSKDKHLNMTYEKILGEHCNALCELLNCEKTKTKALPSNPSYQEAMSKTITPGGAVIDDSMAQGGAIPSKSTILNLNSWIFIVPALVMIVFQYCII